MDKDRYFNFLLSTLKDARPASGRKEIVCQCYYCQDTGHHHHMYVSVPQTEDEPSLFHCFKCHTGGMVTYERLAQWGIYDNDMAVELTSHNKRVAANPINYKYTNMQIYNLRNTHITMDENTAIKLKYINHRLGTNLSYDDILSNKIVLNLKDLLRENWIEKFTRHTNVIDELDSSFIGFLSLDNNFVNMRNLSNNSFLDSRYINYNIFGKADNTMKFYTIPTNIDIYRPIKIHIAEGPFDILSVKYNLRKDFDNCIYTAATGNAYKGALRHFIAGMGLMNLEIHIYEDNDKYGKVIPDIADYLAPFKYPLYSHINLKGKDMGVSIDKIEEYIERIV